MFVLRRSARALLAGLVFASCSAAASSETFWGIGQAKDGDSLMVGSREVRLFGIDAPEFDQQCKRAGQSWACGSEAHDRLSQLATGRDIRCVSVETDQYGRFLSRCSVGGTDLNRAMVALGYAVAFRRYSLDYVSAQASAKAARRGLWSGEFEMPSEFRYSGLTTTRPRAAGRGRCGNLLAMVGLARCVGSRAIGTGEGSGSTICQACPTTTRLELSRPSARRLRRKPRDTEGPWQGPDLGRRTADW